MVEEIKLHLGCGPRIIPGYINVDKANYPHIYHNDVTKLPYEDNSVSLIYSSHLIAYFSRKEILPILLEWKRVLKPEGILRIATPDFGAILHLMRSKNEPLDKFLGPLYGRMDLNGEKIYHKTTYTYLSLWTLLNSLNFRNIHRYDWRDTDTAGYDDCSKSHFPHDKDAIQKMKWDNSFTLISLNVECQK